MLIPVKDMLVQNPLVGHVTDLPRGFVVNININSGIISRIDNFIRYY